VEERFLLGRVALERRHVPGRRVQRPFLIEAHLADAAPVRLHETAMAAREAPDRPALQLFDQLGFPHARIQGLRQ